MSNLTTLGEVRHHVAYISRDYHDELIQVSDLHFVDLKNVRINNTFYHLRQVAQRGIASRYNIPFSYLHKCPQEVQSYNLNYWLRQERNPELFFRFDNQDVRAIFTPRYKPVNNTEIVDKLASLGVIDDTKVQCNLDSEFMLLNIPYTDKKFSVNGGDPLAPGVSIANSEVGLASLSISAFIMRLVCTNGLITKTEVASSFRHVSLTILDRFQELLTNATVELSQQQDKIKFSLESKVNDPAETLERFNKQFQLRGPEIEAVEWAWPLESGFTMFHIVNTYSRAAQFRELTAESSCRLQRVGGTILAIVK